MNTNLIFSSFDIQEFVNYQSWFEDKVLAATLGGIDEEWLDYILEDTTGEEYAVRRGSELVAVVGVVLPTVVDNYFVISNIAVRPDLRGTGLASEVLQGLLLRTTLSIDQFWLAYVSPNNKIAQAFFKKNNWQLKADSLKEDMLRYRAK